MKLIVILAVLLLIGAALYLRTIRTQVDRQRHDRPHRLDDSVSPSAVTEDG